ncbi:replication initiation protein [Pseudochrobactrum asaccharolyticum]|uniref:replication initiation protein n=1 Tax=Pseudochrobactrum asaccharolyticum TaxID=354351 RepID=UPI004042074C
MKREAFTPATRGDISTAIAEKTISKIAPESPRPAPLLDSVKITSEDKLTATDTALYELLLSRAHEIDTELKAAKTSLSDTHTIPVSIVLPYLGSSARRDAVKQALKRLNETTITFGSTDTRLYEDVPLLTSWFESDKTDDKIAFSFPRPIRDLMRRMPGYAYIELAPLPAMKSRYSIRLYKKLALEASKKKWSASGDNTITLNATPAEVAEWAGFQTENGAVSMSKLRDRVLKFVETDFANIRAFGVSFRENYGTGRGRPVESIDFRITLKAPSHHQTHVSFEIGEHKERGIGGVDASEYRVNSMIWTKAQNSFWSIQKRNHSVYFDAWQLALLEAVDEAPVSPGYGRREYRGRRLLNAIQTLGADEAAFKFCAEEVADPDLLVDGDPISVSVDTADAVEARIARIEKSKAPVNAAEAVKKNDNEPKTVVALPFKCRGFDRPPLAKTALTVPQVDETAIEIPATDLDVSVLDAQLLENLISDTPVDPEPTFSLAGIREVMFTADREMSLEEVESDLFPLLEDWDFEGEHTVRVTVRVFVDGCANEYEFGVHKTSADDIKKLHKILLDRRVLDDEINTELELIK